ncbi:MAG: 1-deoxy-D-xylulose-5-phosphate reductoisomerase [Bryobacterales bacterium]|nr:1-deoxy-D-xylulose-5-phosphate reductoisomerase [Bryobacterales bacterium]
MRLAMLGSTGSIGCSTLQVVREVDSPVDVVALAAGRNVAELARQADEFRPPLLSVADEAALAALRASIAGIPGYSPRCVCGAAGNLEVAVGVESDVLVSAAVGVAGLAATYAAVREGRRVALANKEVLVAAGEAVMKAARESGADLLPIDSEHNAVHQCLRAGRRDEVERVILTASGGPFRRTPVEDLARVTPASALRHPTWQMGSRITSDSATMMNKGFEVIEACHLFGLPPERVDVVVHPQSIVHAMVEFVDGSMIAQLSQPDMKLPIRYALAFPERERSPRERMDWAAVPQLDFEPPDLAKFPLLALAYEALRRGGPCGCLLNAADEVAVAAFLAGRIAYLDICRVVEGTLEWGAGRPVSGVEEVMECDRAARAHAASLMASCEPPPPA